MSAIVILATAPNLKVARFLSRVLVENKVAACVSFREGFSSCYRWKGKLERAQEVLLFIKTTRKQFPKIKRLITKHHPYSVPEIIALPVCLGFSPYLEWIKKAAR